LPRNQQSKMLHSLVVWMPMAAFVINCCVASEYRPLVQKT
jgi:hypothetical protein